MPDGLVTPEMGIRLVDPTLRHTTIVRRLNAAERERVVSIGGGPAGLDAAAVLKRRHIDALALEQASEIGAVGRA